MKLALLSIFLALPILAQDDLPAHFTGAYLGFQGSASPQASGGFFVCARAQERTMACITTTQAGAVNDTEGSAWVRVAKWRGASLFGTAGAGVATGPVGVGGAFSGGGALAVPISRLLKVPGLTAVFVGQWQHMNVNQATVGTALRSFGNQASFKFGVGKTF